jgi:hypothetical protein
VQSGASAVETQLQSSSVWFLEEEVVSASHRFSALAALTAAFLISQPVLAFQTPLSDESIREAYFLGQRHDGSFEKLLEKHSRYRPPPKTGPYISSIAFLTPFVNAALRSGTHVGNYSAQQAALDHRVERKETVRIIVEIQLTETYGQFVNAGLSNSRSGDASGLILRSGDFWTDFHLQGYDGDKAVASSATRGHGNYLCGDYGGCVLTGATVELEFPADAFSSDSATVRVDPPKGETAQVNFDLSALR